MATPMRVNSIEEMVDGLDIDSPRTSKSKTSRLRGRMKGKVLFSMESSQGKLCVDFYFLAAIIGG